MRKLIIGLLPLVLLAVGCVVEEEKIDVSNETLVPTAREQELLTAYQLNANTERGQEKLRKLRQRQAQIDSARERERERAQAKRDAKR